MTSISLLTVWSGPLPRYLPLFLGTAAGNPDVRFVFVADSPAPPGLPPNVEWVERPFAELVEEMGGRLGLDLSAVSPYKMCDFKPTFGRSLPDLVGESDFWGHVDCDMVFGDLRASLTEERLGSHDLLSLRGRGFVHGPLTVYRNTDAVNRLFERAEAWRQTLANPTYMGFDESAGWWAWKGQSRPDDAPESFTEVVLRAVADGDVQWYDADHVKESRPHRGMDVRWTCRDGRGALTDEDGRALAYYHFVSAKLDPAFRMPPWTLDAFPDDFVITEAGARAPGERVFPLRVRWAYDKAQHHVRQQTARVRRRLRLGAT